jgi:phosphoribosylformimino-5-aminoimidazole carboxamide ribotide isomerase
MRIIPVIDLKAGQAVHARAGDRAHYRPLRSVLHEGADPIGLARACRRTLIGDELYLADLDAIAGTPPALRIYRELAEVIPILWIDAGVRDRSDVLPLLDAGVSTVVAGLETLRGPSALARIVTWAGADRVVFSLDLRAGRPLIDTSSSWGTDDPKLLAEIALALGVRRILLLDLDRVGTGRGTGTIPLLRALVAASSSAPEIAVGGGIAGVADLTPLAHAGAAAVLIGSALHDGRIDPQMLL